MPRQSSSSINDDRGFLITPRALTSVATIVGLVYTLHAPVRYVLHVGETVEALTNRVAVLETEIDQQRGAIAAEAGVRNKRGEVPRVVPPVNERRASVPRPAGAKSIAR